MYLVVIGFALTYLTGYIFSEIIRLLNLQGPETIYADEDHKIINGDLFIPLIGRKYQKNSLLFLENGVLK